MKLNLIKTPAQLFSKRLAAIKFAQLIIDDLDRIEAVRKLELKKSYLLNSYIINLVAAWQTFIQELLQYSVDKLSSGITTEIPKSIIHNNLSNAVKRFSTPKTSNIEAIFKSVLGLDKIWSHLADSEKRTKEINDILEIRHSIAHTGHSPVPLTLEGNFRRMEILFSTAIELENIVLSRLV